MTSTTNQYGELATQLVTESRRSTLTDNLLKYNDPLVRSIVREQRQLEQSIANALAESSQLDEENAKLDGEDPHTPALLIFQTAIERNKRCLLAYHQHRLDRLRDMYWSAGGSLPHLLSSADTRAKLSPHEVDFLKAYNASVMDFRGAFSDELDITANIMSVPKDLHVLVRVVKDCGVIQTELGAIDFKRGSGSWCGGRTSNT